MLYKDKKGLSEIIGYVLLIVMAIVISVVVYQFLKSYIPKESIECPDDVSVIIKEINCEIMQIEIVNNGLFNISGFIIKGSEDENQVATIPVSLSETNFFPGASEENKINTFGNLAEYIIDLQVGSEIKIIEIIPFMYVKIEDKKEVQKAICGNAKIRERWSC